MDWDEFKATVKASVDIVGLISRDVPGLKQSGSVWRHAPTMDSLIVWPETGTWRRFSTDQGGDVFSWLMRDGAEFIDAARELAELAGVDMPAGDQEGGRVEDERRAVFRALTKAAIIMHRQMPSRIRRHLREHYGFTDETIDDLRIGWAKGNLWDALGLEGIDEDLRLATGLFIRRRQSDEPFELFEDRIVFPYWQRARVVYMIARRTEYTGDESWQQAKYKKIPIKSEKRPYISPWITNEVFYNEDAAGRQTDLLMATEGVTDCISARQAGIPCISPVTTRFRKADLPKLKQLSANTRRLVLCNDAEPPKAGQEHGAGLAGALATATTLWPDRDVRIAFLPREDPETKLDVNEYLREHEGAELFGVLKRAIRLPEWMVQQIPEGAPLDESMPLLDDALRAARSLTELERAAIIDLISRRIPGAGKRAVRARLLELEQEAKDEQGGKPPPPRISGEIHAARTHYYAIGKDGQPSILSSFILDIEYRVTVEGTELLAGTARTQRGAVQNLVFPPGSWSSRRQLVTAIGRMSPDMQWTGNDNQVQGLLALLSAEDVPARQGTDTLGWLDTGDGPVWVTPDALITEAGTVDDAGIVYINDGNPLDSRLSYPAADDEQVRAIAGVALPRITEINDPAVMIPIVGWFFASVFREPLMMLLGHFPGLFVWGSPGCGKTSTVQQMCRMFGIAGAAEPYSATETEFSTLRLLSGTNGAPVWMDEYKPSDMPQRALQRIHRFLRRLYAGERESRGRADQTVRTYRLQAPVIVSGESRPEEQALAERSLIVSPTRAGLNRRSCREAFSQVRALDLGLLAHPYIRHALGVDVRGDIGIARELLGTILGSSMPSPRIVDNLAVMMFGLIQWERFADRLGVALPDIEPLMPGVVGAMLDEVSPAGAARDDLDRFLEQCAMLANAGHIADGKHYAWQDGILWVYLRGMRQVYLERRKAAGQNDDTNGLRALSRMARENMDVGGYVHAVSVRVPIDKTQVRCLGINPDNLPEDLDLDGFGIHTGKPPSTRQSAWDD